MSLKNQVQLVGHIGKDIEVINTENSNKVGKTTMATKEIYKNKEGQRVESTDWHQLVMFGSVCDLASKYIGRGSFVKIQGQLKTRSYVGSDDIKRYSTEIIVNDMLFLDTKK